MPTRQEILSRIRAGDKPLEEPDVTGSILTIIDRLLGNKNPEKSVALQKDLLTVASLLFPAVGALGEAGAGEAATEIPQVLKQLSSPLRRAGGETLMENLPWNRGTTNLNGLGLTEGIGGAGSSGSSSLTTPRLTLATPPMTESLTSPPLVEPLGRVTEPLERYRRYNPKGRFHGSQNPISELKASHEADAGHNLKGPGLYTSNNDVITQEYAGIKKPQSWSQAKFGKAGIPSNLEAAGQPGSVQYRTHQIKAVRWLNLERPAPKGLQKQLRLALGRGGWDDVEIERLMPGRKETVDDWVYRFSSGLPDDTTWNFLRGAAEEEGFGGLRHTGGKVSGGRLHDVKIYWHPQEQVQMVPKKYSLKDDDALSRQLGWRDAKHREQDVGKYGFADLNPAAKPTIPGPTTKAPKPKYVRDVLKTKKFKLPPWE